MDRVTIFSALTLVAVMWSYVPYITPILKNTSRPTISTWLSWLIVDAVILAGMIAKHEVALQVVVYVVGSIVISIILFLKKANVGWRRLDTFCLGIVLIAMVGWYMTGDADVAIVISLIANTVGSIPMFVNLWKEPSNEPLKGWLYALLGSTLGVLAIPHMTVAYALTPIVFFFFQIATIALIVRKRR